MVETLHFDSSNFFHSFGHNYVPSVTWIHRIFYTPSKCSFRIIYCSSRQWLCTVQLAFFFFFPSAYSISFNSEALLPLCKRCLPELPAAQSVLQKADHSVWVKDLLWYIHHSSGQRSYFCLAVEQVAQRCLRKQCLVVDCFQSATCLAWRIDLCWMKEGFRKRPWQFLTCSFFDNP